MDTHPDRDALRALGRRFFEAQDRLRGGPDPDLCAPGYTARIAGVPPLDIDGHRQFAAPFYGAFPDLAHTVDETLADGDRVTVRFTLRGTHQGAFAGVLATGCAVAVPAIAVLRVADGRVAEVDGVFDQMGLMQQIGALPA